MKRRLALARVMLSEPRVLLLDEPFTGLDARGRKWLGEFLRTFKSTGGVVVMVTHSFGVGRPPQDLPPGGRRHHVVSPEGTPAKPVLLDGQHRRASRKRLR